MSLIGDLRSKRSNGRAGARSGARAGAGKKKPKKAERRPPAPEYEQRHLDLVGLVCLGLALYLGFVLYGGWEGGKVGDLVDVVYPDMELDCVAKGHSGSLL